MSRVDVREVVAGATLTSGVNVTLVGPTNLSRYPNKAISVYNLGPTTASGVVIQTNPDPRGNEPGTVGSPPIGDQLAGPNAGLWHDYDTTTFQSLAAGSVKTVEITNSTARWWRLVGFNDAATGASITASGYVYAATV
jgi:hypothetical protein